MKPSDDEIVSFARAHIRHINQQKGKRLVLGFMGAGGILAMVLSVSLLMQKSESVGGFFHDPNFITGVAFGVFGILVLGISVLGFLRMFSMFYGKDIEVYRLLVRLVDEKDR